MQLRIVSHRLLSRAPPRKRPDSKEVREMCSCHHSRKPNLDQNSTVEHSPEHYKTPRYRKKTKTPPITLLRPARQSQNGTTETTTQPGKTRKPETHEPGKP